MSEPLVIAATIAKNRAWALPLWYPALAAQTRPPDHTFVLLNDCTDGSEALLADIRDFGVLNTGDTGDNRIHPRYSIANLAHLRNEMISRVLTRWPTLTHLWSVDSDITPNPDVLAKLLSADLPVCAAVVRNSQQFNIFNYMCGWRQKYGAGDEGSFKSPYRDGTERDQLARSEPFIVSLAGACVLIRRDVLDAGVRYGDHPQGEDAHFSISAMEHGFMLAVHPQARTSHYMEQGEEPLCL